MSSREGGRVSTRDIQLVQNLIERCLQLYMNQKEVVATLLNQAKIEPGFTELVWQKLEEENQEFFKAYRLRLMVKHQINLFNKLLEKQAKMMSQMGPSSVTSLSFSNGSHIPPLHQSMGCYSSGNVGPALKLETVYPTVSCGVSRTFMNGESSQHTAVAMSAAQRMDTPSDLLSAHSSNVGMVQGINGAMIKTEVGYPTGSPFLFGSDGNVLETHQTIADGTVPSFSSIESNSQPLNEPLTDAADASSFGFLGQIPRNFSLSDLTADFSQSSDILEYPRSPFLDQGDDRRLDSISEGLSYEEFGND